jgi:uncharacterized protein (TIGR02145 family)
MKQVICFSLFLSLLLSISLSGQVINSQELEEKTVIKRNAQYNLEEIKVRWKKAALENCAGVPCAFACGFSTIIDMDGNSYNTVLIGTQCWTKENLKVTKYNDGTAISLGDPGSTVFIVGTSTIWQNLTTGAYSIYDNESSTGTNATNYGFLYNWYAAKGVSTNGSTNYKNICHIGWHVPSDGEWTSLIQFIDPTASASVVGIQSTTAGGKLKSISALWNSGSPGTDNYGFTALPGGVRNFNGQFFFTSYHAWFWSASEFDGNNAWSRFLFNNSSWVARDNNSFGSTNPDKSVGGSVRCLRD